MNVLLIGPPGSGKGTQGLRLAEQLGAEHIAAGDLLRAEVAAGSPIGEDAGAYMSRGELVPDRIIIDLVLPKVFAAAVARGYLLDGFPRSVAQADAARGLAERTGASPNAVIYLDVPREELLRRLLARAAEQGRDDDNDHTIANRLEVFEEATRPLVAHYRERGLLHVIDANRDEDAVTQAILAVLPD